MIKPLLLVPLSVGGIIGLLLSLVFIAIAILISQKIFGEEIETKKCFAIGIIAYFVVPVILSIISDTFVFPFMFYIVPLLVWILLGEALLEGEMKTKLMIMVVAFVIYFALLFIGVPSMIAGLIGF